MPLSRLFIIAALAIAAPGVAAAAVTFNLTLTDSTAPTYNGTGSITLDKVPLASGETDYGPADVSALTFTVDGQTFTAAPGSVSAVQFINGTLTDITFAQQIGASPNRYSIATTSGYAFYYDNGQAAAYGTIAARPATLTAVPEPAAWTMMIVGVGLSGAMMRRRSLSRSVGGIG